MELFTFNGRAGRLEHLGISLATSVVQAINFLLFVDLDSAAARGDGTFDAHPLWIVLFVLATWASWCAAIRRCHDLGRSGFFMLWFFVPLIGIAAGLYVLFAPGDDMKNRFGRPPWSISNRAERRAEIERAAVWDATTNRPDPDEAWVNADGSFDMDGLWNESSVQRPAS